VDWRAVVALPALFQVQVESETFLGEELGIVVEGEVVCRIQPAEKVAVVDRSNALHDEEAEQNNQDFVGMSAKEGGVGGENPLSDQLIREEGTIFDLQGLTETALLTTYPRAHP